MITIKNYCVDHIEMSDAKMLYASKPIQNIETTESIQPVHQNNEARLAFEKNNNNMVKVARLNKNIADNQPKFK